MMRRKQALVRLLRHGALRALIATKINLASWIVASQTQICLTVSPRLHHVIALYQNRSTIIIRLGSTRSQFSALFPSFLDHDHAYKRTDSCEADTEDERWQSDCPFSRWEDRLQRVVGGEEGEDDRPGSVVYKHECCDEQHDGSQRLVGGSHDE